MTGRVQTCPNCGSEEMFPGGIISTDQLASGFVCHNCGHVLSDSPKAEARKPEDCCKSRVLITTGPDGAALHIDGERIIFSFAETKVFHDAFASAYYLLMRARLRSEERRLNLHRWVLTAGTASYKEYKHSDVITVSLKRTTPRRVWNCDNCRGALLTGTPHWTGVKPARPAPTRRYDPRSMYWGPRMPRFCDRCVHASKQAPDTVIPPGRPLRLVKT